MRDMNRVILIGRLGKDPVLRETKNGVSVVQFTLATSRKLRAAEPAAGAGSTPPLTEKTEWHRIVAWGAEADRCAQYLKKGEAVCVEGEIRSHSYNDKEGTVRLAFEVHADMVRFLGGISSKKSERSESVELQAMAH